MLLLDEAIEIPIAGPASTFSWSAILGPLAGAIGTGLFGLLLWWLNRKRGQYIVVSEVGVDSLVRIGEKIRQRIAVKFDDRPVQALSQIELRIINAGTEVLKNIDLSFDFGKTSVVLDKEVVPEASGVATLLSQNALKLSLPYMNANKMHGEAVTLKIVCDGPLDSLTIGGRGEGWSVRHQRIERELRLRWWLAIAIQAVSLILMFGYALALSYGRGDSSKEFVSWRDRMEAVVILAGAISLSAIGFFLLLSARRLRIQSSRKKVVSIRTEQTEIIVKP